MNAPKRKPVKRPIWLRPAKLVDPATGELVGALVPAHRFDAEELKRRKLSAADPIRCEIRRRRNPQHFRLAHALARHVAENADGFETLAAAGDWHGVLKRLQAESGVACEPMELDLGALGKHSVQVPQSLSFEEMEQSRFSEVFRGLCEHVVRRYWPSMTPDQIEEQAEMLSK